MDKCTFLENFTEKYESFKLKEPTIDNLIDELSYYESSIPEFFSKNGEATGIRNMYSGIHEMMENGIDKSIKCICNTPTKEKYSRIAKAFYPERDFTDSRIIPTIITGWDHTPRSGKKGVAMTDYTPTTFRKVLSNLLDKKYNTIQYNTSEADNLIFLKSWNEWGEGNFIEPELRYGKDFLNVLREELNKYQQ